MTRPKDSNRLSDVDALLWRIESDPLLRSTVIMVSVFDRPLDRDRMLDRGRRSTARIERLRQRIGSGTRGVPQWEDDPHFDLNYHLRFMHAPGERTLRDVLDFAVPVGMAGFDRSRPLWENYVIDDMADGTGVLIQKVHHSVTDGVGGMELVLAVMDLERDPLEEIDPATLRQGDEVAPPPQRGLLARAVSSSVRGLRSPRSAVARTNEVLASFRRTMEATPTPESPLMTNRSLSARYDTLTIPLKPFKKAAKSVGGTVNEAYISAILGGLRAYHSAHGVEVDQLRMTLPVNTRDAGLTSADGYNQFVPTRFLVPMTVSDPVERMVIVRDRLTEELAEPSLEFSAAVATMLNRLPTPMITKTFGGMLKGVDFIASNVPGPPVDLFQAGARVQTQFPFGPLAGAAVNFTLLSGPEFACVGVNSDPAAVPDPETLLECLQQGVDEILKLAD